MRTYFSYFLLLALFSSGVGDAMAQKGISLVIDSLEDNFTWHERKNFRDSEKLMDYADEFLTELGQLEAERKDYAEQAEQAKKGRHRRKYTRMAKRATRNANKKRIDAIYVYIKALDLKFDVYNKKLKDYVNSNVPDAAKAKILWTDAEKLMAQAKNNYNDLNRRDDFNVVSKKCAKAATESLQAINNQIKALCLFMNCLSLDPPEFYREFNSEPSLSVEESKPSLCEAIVESIDYAVDEKTDTISSEDATNITNFLNSNKRQCSLLAYRVQILAVTNPISQQKLAVFFSSNDAVFEFQDVNDNLWKYWIGQVFSNYDEAQEYSDASGVEDAFVIALCDDQRISIDEALEIEN